MKYIGGGGHKHNSCYWKNRTLKSGFPILKMLATNLILTCLWCCNSFLCTYHVCVLITYLCTYHTCVLITLLCTYHTCVYLSHLCTYHTSVYLSHFCVLITLLCTFHTSVYFWLIDWQFYFSSVTHLVQLLFSVAAPYTHHSYI